MNVRDFIEEEVEHQGFARGTAAWEQRIEWMALAWENATEWAKASAAPHLLTAIYIKRWGQLIEPELNQDGWRQCSVQVGGRVCPDYRDVPTLINFFEKHVALYTPPLEAYRQFQLIHPFRDGNGRVGKIIYAWLTDTLDNPEFPPDLFGGGVP